LDLVKKGHTGDTTDDGTLAHGSHYLCHGEKLLRVGDRKGVSAVLEPPADRVAVSDMSTAYKRDVEHDSLEDLEMRDLLIPEDLDELPEAVIPPVVKIGFGEVLEALVP
jgi:hypothetical protein